MLREQLEKYLLKSLNKNYKEIYKFMSMDIIKFHYFYGSKSWTITKKCTN